MKLFKTYSEENCLLECRAKQLFKKCHCLPYYYPRLDLLFSAKTAQHPQSFHKRSFVHESATETKRNVNDKRESNKNDTAAFPGDNVVNKMFMQTLFVVTKAPDSIFPLYNNLNLFLIFLLIKPAGELFFLK